MIPAPFRLCLLLAVFVVGVFAASSPPARPLELRTFTAKSFAEIKRAHAGRPFILAFWSVSCEPCREEMLVVAELHRKRPQLSIVLVAADPPATQAAVRRFLAKYELGRIEVWQFDNDAQERLRYSVDPGWAGELPRSYLFNAAHEPTAQSGVVDPQWLEAWAERETRSGPR